MSGKMICPECHGNGYKNVYPHKDDRKRVEIDCDYCKNQGEIEITEEVLKDLESCKRKQ